MKAEQRLNWREVHPAWRLSGPQAWVAAVHAGPKAVCLIKKGEQVFAVSAKCPHQGAPLAGGFLNEQGQIVCPWHRLAFHPEDGRAAAGGYFLDTFPVRMEGRRLFVGIPKPWWSWS